MLPPSARLPPIKRIAAHPPASLNDALQYLSLIYSPPVRGTRRRRAPTSSSVNVSTSTSEEPGADELRTDAFERAYAIKWLTALVSTLGDEQEGAPGSAASAHAHLVETAAALLAACAGTSAAGVVTRTLIFPAAGAPVRIALTDAPLDNADYASVGAQTWGGACVMSEMIAEDPGAFGLGRTAPAGGAPLRLLELGAGTGLVSLVLAALASRATAPVEIVATDYYPSVLANLARNVRANYPSSPPPIITTVPLDWAAFPGTPHAQRPCALQAPFDVVFGADIVYEAPHAAWLRDCLATLLRRPAATSISASDPTPAPVFHLIIPLRATHAAESRTVEQVFARTAPPGTGGSGDDDAAMALVIEDMQTLVCTTETPGEEVTYAYYRIGWGPAAEV
ncbi:hypothetical protein HYPSUDRAFT_143863 [Hypholoma sublateritium FD-334 SS-4]|uniref:FAM86 N-terminal domain-containing protein n=1 Tax=Hypholoma sublateritium (strain FD-334 SS-4) TaxID=945553 RepID=A0A0D2NRC9_HYPSF|nr:hypothetical protein HYPSUDRAFT_143863 [Hypholoma sublateritium FD-334 SS-4]